jgi:hypothetical protein
MEILFAFAVFYIVWRLAVGVLRAIADILRLLALPFLWLAHRQAQQAQRRRQRSATMARLRQLAR